jgi:hypothetical protein
MAACTTTDFVLIALEYIESTAAYGAKTADTNFNRFQITTSLAAESIRMTSRHPR